MNKTLYSTEDKGCIICYHLRDTLFNYILTIIEYNTVSYVEQLKMSEKELQLTLTSQKAKPDKLKFFIFQVYLSGRYSATPPTYGDSLTYDIITMCLMKLDLTHSEILKS